jgi:MurNAc alpha-1-phosphate uridylyltransferase
VPNPEHNPKGDFGLRRRPGLNTGGRRHTYSTTGLFRRRFFDGLPAGNPEGLKGGAGAAAAAAMDRGQVSAELYTGPWTDVGTPQRLAQLNA